MKLNGRPSSPAAGDRSASAQPTSCCSAARQNGSRGDGGGNEGLPQARASCPDTQACAGCPITTPSRRTSTASRLDSLRVSRTQRLSFLAIAAVIAIVAVVILTTAGGGDDEQEATSAQQTATPTPTETAAAPGETPTETPTPTPKPQPPLVIAGGELDKLRFEQGDTVRFRVRSGVADHVHVHGYDLMKDVAPGKTITFSFPAEITGIFEIELEDRGEEIAQLRVDP